MSKKSTFALRPPGLEYYPNSLPTPSNTGTGNLNVEMADTFTNALSRVRLDRSTLALSTAAVLGTALVLPSIYRDYRTFRDYGPGGLPNNVIGWLTCRALLQPFKREMFSTEEYVKRVEAAEGHGKGDEGFLELSPEQLASRSVTDRPVVGPHVVPQRQLTQIPDEDVMEVSGVLPWYTVSYRVDE